MNNTYELASKNMNDLITMTLNDPETFVKHLDTAADNAASGLVDCDFIWGLKNAVFFKYQECVYVLDLDRWILYTVIDTGFMLSKAIPEEGITGVEDELDLQSY
jgi:hypothetical protein